MQLTFFKDYLNDISIEDLFQTYFNANRTIGNFYQAIQVQNAIISERKPNKEKIEDFIASMNSYFGIFKHYKTYKIRKRMIFGYLLGWWCNHVYLSGGYKKFNKMYRSIL